MRKIRWDIIERYFKPILKKKQWMLGNKEKRPVDHAGIVITAWDYVSCYTYKDAKKHIENGRACRIGLQALKTDDLIFLDIDNVVDNEKLIPTAKDIINLCNDTYCELSASKRGIHLVGKLPDKLNLAKRLKTRKTLKRQTVFYNKSERLICVEIFLTGGWINISGNVLPNLNKIKKIEPKKILKILEKYIPHSYIKCVKPKKSIRRVIKPTQDQDMDEVKKIMFRSKRGKIIKELFEGDLILYEGDHSRADMSLLSSLHFFTRGNRDLCIKLFRVSKLWRTKKRTTEKKYIAYLEKILDKFEGNDVRKPNYWKSNWRSKEEDDLV